MRPRVLTASHKCSERTRGTRRRPDVEPLPRVKLNQAGRVEGVVVMIATEPQREVLVPIKRVKRATADKKIVVAATRDELKARRKLEEPIPDTRADQL